MTTRKTSAPTMDNVIDSAEIASPDDEVTMPVSDRSTLDTYMAVQTAPAWRPEPGDRLTGVCVAVLKMTSRYNTVDGSKIYPKIVYETPNGYVAVHAFHGMLLQAHRELRTGPGDLQTTYYAGQKVKNPKNRVNADDETESYHHYVVVPGDGSDLMVDAQEFSWGEPDF